MNDDSEFFIGWQGRAPPVAGRRLARLTIVLTLLALAVVTILAALQRTIGRARWDYGNELEFNGVLVAHPVPTLLTDMSKAGGRTAASLLVYPNKFGFDRTVARSFDQQRVRLRATSLQRDGQTMLEVQPGSIVALDPTGLRASLPEIVDLGEHLLQGEIVDSKCFLGAMNPGVLKPHRACAIRCINGGVPPVLLVRDPAGNPVYYLLVGASGEAINRDVLDFVAEPVEIRGRVQQRGEQLVLRASPGSIRRLP
jgi:hypothetical protein